jgi:hypothetical protein
VNHLLAGTQFPDTYATPEVSASQSDDNLRAATGCMFYGPAFGAAGWAVLILAAWACL